MRVTLKAINAELAKRGHHATLVNGDGYFNFRGGEAVDWLDRTVRVPTLSSLSVDQWVKAFQDLKKKNAEIQHAGKGATAGQSESERKANKRRK
jgi:hypothetical protein